MNMSPYELAMYLEQQRQKRHETMKELLELELFLAWRARGMLLETPGVRP